MEVALHFSPHRYCDSETRLVSGLMTLHVHRDRTDSIDLVAAANQFVGEQENRKQLFGSFTTNDLSQKVSLVSRSTQTSL